MYQLARFDGGQRLACLAIQVAAGDAYFACGFDFAAAYGDRGEGFIEAHHKVPVSQMREGDKTQVQDIAMLCSNCHRMIHRAPLMTVEKLAALVGRH